MLAFLAAPFVASLILTGIHAYLGVHVVERGVIFVDLSLAQIAALAPYKGTKIVTYHRSWPNFADRFGLDVMGYVEPRPGIPPSPSHTLDLINEMKRQNVKLILVEPYFDLKTPQSIGRETGAEVLMLPPSVGGAKEVTDYIGLFDYDVNAVVAAIKRTGAK